MKKICRALFVTFVLAGCPAVASAQTFSRQIKGFTEPYRSIDIAAPEMGTISEISVQEGDRVGANTILARLNEDVLEASLAMASESRDAKGKLNSALAELKMQQERMEKLTGLYDRRHASQIELDRAKAQLEVAGAQVEAVKDELRIKGMEIKRIKAQLEQRRLRSPIDGIVTRIFKDEGEFVSANDPVVVKVVQLNPLLIIFSVPQQQASNLSAGETVTLTVGTNAQAVEGAIEFVSPTADAQSGTCRVKIRIDNPDNQWQSGIVCHLKSNAITSSKSPNKSESKVFQSSARLNTNTAD